MNLDAYPSSQFKNVWPGTKIKLNPGNTSLALGFLGWATGLDDPGDAGTDAFIYGHINKSEVLRGGLIQLAPDTFSFHTDYDDRILRDIQTDLQWLTLGGASSGRDFQTFFVGPTRIPY